MTESIEQLIEGKRLYALGKKAPADFEAMLKLCTPLVKMGNAKAMFNIGFCHRYGLGVGKSIPVAREWFEKAIAKEDPLAMFEMFSLYANGIIEDNAIKKQRYLDGAANLGEPRALCVLGDRAFLAGDIEAAFVFYKTASTAGSARAVAGLLACSLSFGAEYIGDSRVKFSMKKPVESAAEVALFISVDGVGYSSEGSKVVMVDGGAEYQFCPPYDSFSGKEFISHIEVNGLEFFIEPVEIVDWSELVSSKLTFASLMFRISKNRGSFEEVLKSQGHAYFERKLTATKEHA